MPSLTSKSKSKRKPKGKLKRELERPDHRPEQDAAPRDSIEEMVISKGKEKSGCGDCSCCETIKTMKSTAVGP